MAFSLSLILRKQPNKNMRAFLGVDFLDALTDLAQEGLLDFALDDPRRH